MVVVVWFPTPTIFTHCVSPYVWFFCLVHTTPLQKKGSIYNSKKPTASLVRVETPVDQRITWTVGLVGTP